MNLKHDNAPLMEIRKLTKVYHATERLFHKSSGDVTALNQVSLSMNRGEIFGLVGQSGSGKSTAGRLLVHLEKPTSGEIRLAGEPATRLRGAALKAYRRRVQMIFQDPYQSLNPHLTIAETVLEPLIVHEIGTPQAQQERMQTTLDTVGLSPARDFQDRFPHQLSGGQRQRVAIARAIILEPEFVVADEPTSMLDATIAIQLFQVLLDIREKLGVTFLFITHNLAAALYLCDRIAVIQEGTIVETGRTRRVIESPEHPYTRKLISAQPRFDRCPVV